MPNINRLSNMFPFKVEAEMINRAINGALGIFQYLEARGLERDRVLALLERAEAEGRDVTNGEVNGELERTSARLAALREAAESELDNGVKNIDGVPVTIFNVEEGAKDSDDNESADDN